MGERWAHTRLLYGWSNCHSFGIIEKIEEKNGNKGETSTK
jgi:hypothetical protein